MTSPLSHLLSQKLKPGKMAQLVGVLFVQVLELNSNPSTHVKIWAWLPMPIMPRLENGEGGGVLVLAGHQRALDSVRDPVSNELRGT